MTRMLDRIAYGELESEDRREAFNQSMKKKCARSLEGTVWVPRFVLESLPPKQSLKREAINKALEEGLKKFTLEDIDKNPLPKDRVCLYVRKEQIEAYKVFGKQLGVRGSLIIRSVLINLGKNNGEKLSKN